MLTPSHAKIENVMAQLQLHLAPNGPRLPWPVYYEAVEQRECIPTPQQASVPRQETFRLAQPPRTHLPSTATANRSALNSLYRGNAQLFLPCV